MASDYKKIAEDHEKQYGWDAKPRRIYKRLYSDKTHFVYELIQNADDSGSDCLELQLNSNTLLVWNDGRQFTEEDVRNICSLGSSDKDLTDIGAFGIGFKAVYNYAEFPEIYSNDERFRIRDFIKPEGIDEITPEIVKLVDEDKTVFRLPFKNNLPQDDLEHLKNRLCDLSKERSLLFLRCLKRVEWKDEHNGQVGSYSCHRHPYEKIQDVPENESIELVKLRGSLNGKSESSETFLAFYKNVHPPKDVIDQLLEQAEDEEEQQRIQQSAEEPQPIEVAFKLRDDRITPMDDNCVLFAYLPTQKETHLKFLIQARYQTTPARDNIPKPNENPWNEWLVRETAKYLPEILEQLKASGLLEPAFFNVLPLKEEVENDFKPIAKAARKAMREKLLIPTEDDGYARAESVFYPHHGTLRKLVECSWIYPNSSWLHPDIGRSGRAFRIMQEAGVKEINVSQVLNWLEKRDVNWFKGRCKKWLRSLYVYLNDQKSQLERINGLERIKKLPLIRLENGRHVCASERLVFFPPETDEAREEIKPFLNELPILQSDLLKEDERNDIEGFLRDLGVLALNPADLIGKWIIPQYSQSDKPSKEQNSLHVGYLFKVWDKLSGYEHRNLRVEISETPFLRAYKDVQPETFDFVKPCDAYLPEAYTGNADLEAYFSVYNGDIWFVDDTYLEDDSNRKDWPQFLKAIGAKETPRVNEVQVIGNSEECEERGITWQRSTREFENGGFIDRYYSGHFDGAIEDFEFVGLLEVFNQISDHNKVNLSRSLWSLLLKAIEPLSSEKKIRWPRTSSRDAFFQCTYHWFYNGPKEAYFDATFYSQLKEIAWLPDEQGNLHQPSELFTPTDSNRRVLGDSVVYLHPDFNVGQNNETGRWLADKLDIHLSANTDSVINYLRTLSSTEASIEIEKVLPLYRFLEDQGARREPEFKAASLIFISDPEPSWWKSDEVFWEDESPVFGNRCGYLKENYADYETTLKPFFIALGVSPGALPSDYVRVIRKVASVETAEDAEVRARVEVLYGRLWQSLREGGSFLDSEEWRKEWEQTRKGRYWLGKEGSEWDFFFLHELVWKDDDYRSRLLQKGKIPFWTFDNGLLEFAKHLGVKGCYQASDVEFDYYGDQGEYQIWSEKLQNLYPYIYDFLKSSRLCEGYIEEKSAEIVEQLSVRRAQRLKIRYRLNGVPVPDPNPRQSFLDKKGKILWLGLEEDEEAYPDLIGDALQDNFRIDQLREFVKDLLPAANLSKTALLTWERRGFQPNLCLVPPELDFEEGEKNPSELVDERFSGEPGSEEDSGTDNSDLETPTIHEDPETGNENDDSTENGSEPPAYRSRPSGGGTRPRRSKGVNTPSGNRGVGHSSSRSGDTGGETHIDATDTSPQDRREIERIGMEHARHYEEGKGHTVEDVSTENLGYDLRSTTPKGEIRYIEVKARAERAPVVLTSNEWSVAEQLENDYFLYVVLDAATQPDLYIIRNPADVVSPIRDIRYQVPLSEITEHGIRV